MVNRLPTPAMDFCWVNGDCWAYWLYNWQTLIGGAIALFAAFFAGWYVRQQIKASEQQVQLQLEAAERHVRKQIEAGERQVRQQIEASERQTRAAEQQEQARQRRRETAARAVFPLTLTQFNDYAKACAAVLSRIQGPTMTPVDMRAAPMQTPQLPPQALADLERMIEAATNDRAIELMAKLAGHTQVLHSVITDLVANVNAHGSNRARIDPNMPYLELRTARVHAAASRLYEWARGQSAEPEEMTWDHIETALQLMNIGDERIMGLINRRRGQSRHPLDW